MDEKTKEKFEKLKVSIRNYKEVEANLLNQVRAYFKQTNVLKSEIKVWQDKFNKIMNFDGKIKNYEEFKVYLSKILENYKPK